MIIDKGLIELFYGFQTLQYQERCYSIFFNVYWSNYPLCLAFIFMHVFILVYFLFKIKLILFMNLGMVSHSELKIKIFCNKLQGVSYSNQVYVFILYDLIRLHKLQFVKFNRKSIIIVRILSIIYPFQDYVTSLLTFRVFLYESGQSRKGLIHIKSFSDFHNLLFLSILRSFASYQPYLFILLFTTYFVKRSFASFRVIP